jgi:hypothetical protein
VRPIQLSLEVQSLLDQYDETHIPYLEGREAGVCERVLLCEVLFRQSLRLIEAWFVWSTELDTFLLKTFCSFRAMIVPFRICEFHVISDLSCGVETTT